MNKSELLESGLLELYIIGSLDEKDTAIVEKGLIDFPSLKQDLHEIEKALQLYAKVNGVPAPSHVIDSVISNIKTNDGFNTNDKPSKDDTNISQASIWTKMQPILSLIALLGLCTALYLNSNKLKKQKVDYEQQIEECNKEKDGQLQQLAILESMTDVNNKVILAEATEKYPATLLYLNSNSSTGKNYLQIQNLPALAADQSYQLWSLKGDNPPQPLDVFENDVDNIFEVNFVPGTDAYAITVEPKGGQDSPTLENLVAIIKMS